MSFRFLIDFDMSAHLFSYSFVCVSIHVFGRVLALLMAFSVHSSLCPFACYPHASHSVYSLPIYLFIRRLVRSSVGLLFSSSLQVDLPNHCLIYTSICCLLSLSVALFTSVSSFNSSFTISLSPSIGLYASLFACLPLYRLIVNYLAFIYLLSTVQIEKINKESPNLIHKFLIVLHK